MVNDFDGWCYVINTSKMLNREEILFFIEEWLQIMEHPRNLNRVVALAELYENQAQYDLDDYKERYPYLNTLFEYLDYMQL